MFGRVIAAVTLAIGAAGATLAISVVFCWITMLMWNWLMPELFGLKAIDIYQAWGITFLCGILFKDSK